MHVWQSFVDKDNFLYTKPILNIYEINQNKFAFLSWKTNYKFILSDISEK